MQQRGRAILSWWLGGNYLMEGSHSLQPCTGHLMLCFLLWASPAQPVQWCSATITRHENHVPHREQWLSAISLCFTVKWFCINIKIIIIIIIIITIIIIHCNSKCHLFLKFNKIDLCKDFHTNYSY